MNPGSTILITGGTGLVGNAITAALLERGFHVIVLTRNQGNQNSNHPHLTYKSWNVEKQEIDNEAIKKADYIIHLAGASIAEKRWTTKRKKEIVNSRVDSGKLIVEILRTNPNKIKTVISASATGWYGPDPEKDFRGFKESDPAASDFLGQTCKQWEAAIDPVIDLGVRLVKLRLGIVLSNDGGALKEFKKPLQFGIATIPGNGSQVMSWIHIDDVVRMFLFMLDNENIYGTFNAVSPNPVTNKELILQMATTERGRFFIPIHVPSIALKIIIGEMSVEILKSFTVSAEKILKAGFIFQYQSIEKAIEQLSGK
ncbi:MAG TPA: TIGR01777 family oxidoreductase [Chitinophagaceae bacterium]|nr:TIGR01777 family oxidoreductase [Chitinophagaceae bacterium]